MPVIFSNDIQIVKIDLESHQTYPPAKGSHQEAGYVKRAEYRPKEVHISTSSSEKVMSGSANTE